MTQQDKPLSLNELESQVKIITSNKHQKELSLIENLLKVYLEGFNSINSFTLTYDNDVQYAWLLLLTRSFHCMRCATLIMHTGYYGEALSLLRTAFEAWFAAKDCENNPKTLKALLHEQLRLNWGNIAENVKADKLYKSDYKHLSKFTHISRLSLATLREPETNNLKTHPIYDEILFLDCCEMLVRLSILMSELMLCFLLKQSNLKSDSWGNIAEPVIIEARDWLKELRAKYGN
ncbi:MAG: hypothetical protein MUO89_01110 [Dehalococcoidia bacterium]|nr:hypothetical protein [Dehalococcoidia bacterium]